MIVLPLAFGSEECTVNGSFSGATAPCAGTEYGVPCNGEEMNAWGDSNFASSHAVRGVPIPDKHWLPHWPGIFERLLRHPEKSLGIGPTKTCTEAESWPRWTSTGYVDIQQRSVIDDTIELSGLLSDELLALLLWRVIPGIEDPHWKFCERMKASQTRT
jgi:hypothetical protein